MKGVKKKLYFTVIRLKITPVCECVRVITHVISEIKYSEPNVGL